MTYGLGDKVELDLNLLLPGPWKVIGLDMNLGGEFIEIQNMPADKRQLATSLKFPRKMLDDAIIKGE